MFLKKFSEDPADRMTGRTNKSIEFSGDITGKSILNIGSLGGWYEDWILNHDKYERLTGLDLPGTCIPELQEKYRDNPRIEFVEGSVLELPFPKNSFDVVALWEVLEHLPKNSETIALLEINRVLRKDGVLLLSTPHHHRWGNLLDPVWYFGHRHYTKDQIQYLMKESGFFVYDIDIFGGWYELLTMLPFYFFKWVFRSEIPFKNFFEKKRAEEYTRPGFTNIFVKATKNRES